MILYQQGKIPITYSAPLLSCSTFVAFIIYAAAIVFPYLICGWTKDFFTLYETNYEQPYIYTTSEISLYDAQHNLTFSIPMTSDVNVIPIFERTSRTDLHDITFSLILPTSSVQSKTGSITLKFPYKVEFNKTIHHVFTGKINTVLRPFEPVCQASISGFLGFNQQLPYTKNIPPTAEGYQDYAEENDLPITDGDLRLYGQPYFQVNAQEFVYGTCDTFTLKFKMRAPMLAVRIENNFWYAFLSGWTKYIAVAVPFIFFARCTLSLLFGSGLLASTPNVEAVLAKPSIKKFNRN
ncbi:hypothetical protein TVAG_159470 [Trichomonas vaginalis G3]|uniref:Uncharacterized protein n=1 Tax=Trichomonas vaginalis (strain ATCC PRA-98 / G3) TaxID=412133 RepID=A2F5A2_TRIV3|nr:transmembrane protein 231 family [Trichomonas vaginalis G3]EAX99927.1 hypothetical protein TVAG_159470 [Trichomonas vaginalis G3]KAI5547792.1 transmembrane protein 231 family [Trichomonas vaginalis G3]|eukprot:XP_001312857.1 hypothetical protein [Trichomonas vaginalis G3]